MTLAARYVLPGESPPIQRGLVTITRGRIQEVGKQGQRRADIDLGNVAIVPGFVNAHTHLELGPIPSDESQGAEDEIAWLRRVIQQRRASPEGGLETRARASLAQALQAGTTLVGDITTAGASWPAIAAAPVRAVVYSELIGLQRMRGLQSENEAWEWLKTIKPEGQVAACARPGLSPHAPYSTAGWLYHRAAGTRMPLATHLAEMPEELELLAHGTGRLREFLEDLGAWDNEWGPIGQRPADYVRKGDLKRADWLIAHGNYLDRDDFWQLRAEAAADGHRVAVAYCPRTHARFGHAPHPFRAMLDRGIVVCLGTDSLASAPSLSVLDEARYLRRVVPELPGPLLLAMATIFGAWALRAETVTGSLSPGKSADLAIVALPDQDAADPHDLLFEAETPVLATMFEGKFHHLSKALKGLD